MKDEYDFSKGEQGKFYRPDVEFRFPVYLEPDVDKVVTRLAGEREVEVQDLVNEWLRASIRVIDSVAPKRRAEGKH